MKGDLLINGKDAYTEYGVAMGDGFLQELLKPAPLKEFVENSDRSRNGKQVLYGNPRIATREITLQFNIEGATQNEYLTRYRGFAAMLQQGAVSLQVPGLGEELYRLTYLDSSSFALSANRCFSTLAVRFNEPNPADRANH